MASWSEVVAFSTPLSISGANDQVTTSTPMRMAQVIRLDTQGERESVAMRWGFSERRANAPDVPKHMHARCETIDSKPTFRDAFATGRGILLVSSFNEGEEVEVVHDDGTPAGRTWTRQWVIEPADNQPIAIAVICERWTRGEQRLETFVQVTTPANPLIAKITDRMPAILKPEDWPVWLGETDASLAEVKGVLRSFHDEGRWTMRPEDASKKPPRPRNPVKRQRTLF